MTANIIGTAFTFTGNNGKEYSIPPWTLIDLGKFTKWVQYAPYRDAIEVELPKSKQDEIYEECKRGIVIEKIPPDDWEPSEEKPDCPKELLKEIETSIDLFSTVVNNKLTTIEGIFKIACICCPELKEDGSGVIDRNQLIDFQTGVLKLNGLIKDKVKSENEDEDSGKNL